MLTKTRSDFWKCACNIQPCTTDKCSECEVSQFYGDDATNVEVLIAWLLASDENRRREIEIASRPTKAGNYKRWYWDDGDIELDNSWPVEEGELPEIKDYESSFWEPTE